MFEQLKNKMYNHEELPPRDVWSAIERELEGFSPDVAARVGRYEATPPPDAWNHIAAVLEKESATPVRILARWRPARITAAAAVLIVLLTGAYYLSQRNNGRDESTASRATASSLSTDQQTESVAPQIDPADTLSSYSPLKSKAPLSSYYVHHTPVKKRLSGSRERLLHSCATKNMEHVSEKLTVSISPHEILGESGEPIQDMSIVNPFNRKYVSITAPNGEPTRVSSKLAIAMPYLGMLDHQGVSLQMEALNWKQLIESWRERIIKSGFVPSSGNYLDILELSDLIKD
ncbi:MAG: anti-sigma factor [Chitinophagaceae bacterium]|nr:anti-sigma factor [Chitinophagaceae bacterium]